MIKWDVAVVSRFALVLALGAGACGRFGYDATGDGGIPVDSDIPIPDVFAADVIPPPDATVSPDAATNCTPSGTTACPKGVSFADPSPTLQVGGGGGSPFDETCPAGEVLVAYTGAMTGQGYIGKVQATCARVQISSSTLAVTLAPGALLAAQGSGNGQPWSVGCPSDQMIVGFGGRSGLFVDRLEFMCAPLRISGAPGSYTIAIGNITFLPGVGGTGGSPFPDQFCPDGRVGTAHFGRKGLYLDAFGVLCNRAVLTY
jgi:hypothetical protein